MERVTLFKQNRIYHYVIGIVIAALFTAASCGFDGGLNQNQQNAGNQDDGVSLSFGNIAIDPTGTFFLSSSGDKLLLGEIDETTAEVLPGIHKPVRMAFGRAGRIFVTTRADRGQLIAYDVRSKNSVWTLRVNIDNTFASLDGSNYPLLEVSEDHSKLIVTDRSRLRVLSTEDGCVLDDISFPENVIDIDLHPDGEHVIITLDHLFDEIGPKTEIVTLSMTTKVKSTITVPNCSDELVLSPDGSLGFLAPTRCSQDPVSVIDFKEGEFVRNLPGFGPVAMSASGDTAIAFMDMEDLDESLFDSPEDIPPAIGGRYRLMFIDVGSLKFDTVDIGNNLPRYAMTPDGQMLLVDSDEWFLDTRLRVLDIESRQIHKVAGPDVRLGNFVITSDSTRVLLLDNGLFHMSIQNLVVESVALLFTPKNINLTPDDTHLLLRENDFTLWVYDVESRQTLHNICLGKHLEG